MKTLEYALEHWNGYALDKRDHGRLMCFAPNDYAFLHGYEVEFRVPLLWNRDTILGELKSDLEFAFEKALGRRGISAQCMFEVVRMYNWILEEGLENWNPYNYEWYGLPLLKATAVKYGLDNPIGDDAGTEGKYSG